MLEIIFFAVLVILIQLSGMYLVVLAFKRELSDETLSNLRKKFVLCTVINFLLGIFVLKDGITISNYEILLFAEWVVYIAALMYVVRNKFFKQIFVLGMQGLWTFMLQSATSMIILFKSKMFDEMLFIFLIMHLLIYLALLPIERNLFSNIFPAEEFFKVTPLKYFFALFPLAILIGTAIPIIETTFLQTWQGKFSRIIVPIFFFASYRSFSISTRKFEDEEREEKLSRLARQQISQLHEQNLLVIEGRRNMENLRANLNEKYSLLEKLIKDNKIQEAKRFISEQEFLLQKTYIKRFCDAPLINAALSIYFQRAAENNIKVTEKINLPKKFSTDEADLSILISNLLENAIQAGLKQKKNQREISIILQHFETQCVLEISNRYDFPVEIGENNLPSTDQYGHGFGMHSLKNFAKKYDAYVDFSQKNNFVTVQIYWEEGGQASEYESGNF